MMLPTEYLEESNPGGGEVDADNMLIDAVVDLREATAFLIEGVLIPLLAVFGIIGECKFFPFRFDNTRSPIALPSNTNIKLWMLKLENENGQ